jgi:signal transduction histidine kinase
VSYVTFINQIKEGIKNDKLRHIPTFLRLRIHLSYINMLRNFIDSKRQCLCCAIGLLLACFMCGTAIAQPMQTQEVSRVLNAEVAYIEDVSGKWVLEDVKGENLDKQFQTWSADKGAINLGVSASAYWLRIRLERDSDAPMAWVLEIPFFQLQTLDFYAPGRTMVRTGAEHPLSSRPIFHRYFSFPVELAPRTQTFYLRVINTHSMTLPLVLWQERAFRDHVQSTFIIQSLYFGGLLALLAYNLFIYLSLRDLRFLLYSLFTGSFGLGMLAGNGFGQMFLWSHRFEFDTVAQVFFLGIAASFAMLFSDVFLQARRDMPVLSRLFRSSAIGFLLLAMLLLTCNWHPIPTGTLVIALMWCSIPAGVLVVFTSARVLLRGQQGVRFFLLAWSTLWIGVFVAALRVFGWIPTNTITSYSLQISSVAEMLLLSLALADMMNSERQGREAAQKDALAAKQKLLEIALTSEERLEHAVEKRTAQLKKALDSEVQLLAQYMRFGALISHEFRNPLGIINSQISLMRKEHEMGQLQLDKRLSTMSSAARRLLSLFEKWLQGDRLNHALQDMNETPIVLSAWLSELIDAQSQYHATHRLEFKPANTQTIVMADEDLLEIAILNLIDNACKYSEPDSLVQIELRMRHQQLGIAVIDQGQGIAQEHQTKIFEDYFRITPEGPVRGLGLGLPFVLRIAQMHQGQLELQSKRNKGSTFCLWLPLQKE